MALRTLLDFFFKAVFLFCPYISTLYRCHQCAWRVAHKTKGRAFKFGVTKQELGEREEIKLSYGLVLIFLYLISCRFCGTAAGTCLSSACSSSHWWTLCQAQNTSPSWGRILNPAPTSLLSQPGSLAARGNHWSTDPGRHCPSKGTGNKSIPEAASRCN